MLTYRVSQNGTDVFTDTRDEYVSILEVVPAEWLDNMQVTATTTVYLDDEVVSIVEPFGG